MFIISRRQRQLGDGVFPWMIREIDPNDTDTWPRNHELYNLNPHERELVRHIGLDEFCKRLNQEEKHWCNL